MTRAKRRSFLHIAWYDHTYKSFVEVNRCKIDGMCHFGKYLMIILSLFFAAVFGELGKRLVDTPADGASETW